MTLRLWDLFRSNGPSCLPARAGAVGASHTVTDPSAFFFKEGRVLSMPASF
jgi:hypothetical protein